VTIAAAAQAALAALAAANPELVVAVVIGSVSDTGIRVTRSGTAATMGARGDAGFGADRVRVSAATFTEVPTVGSTVTVGGVRVRVDNAGVTGGIMRIDYSETRQAE
jgi:hypothetical protein